MNTKHYLLVALVLLFTTSCQKEEETVEQEEIIKVESINNFSSALELTFKNCDNLSNSDDIEASIVKYISVDNEYLETHINVSSQMSDMYTNDFVFIEEKSTSLETEDICDLVKDAIAITKIQYDPIVSKSTSTDTLDYLTIFINEMQNDIELTSIQFISSCLDSSMFNSEDLLLDLTSVVNNYKAKLWEESNIDILEKEEILNIIDAYQKSLASIISFAEESSISDAVATKGWLKRFVKTVVKVVVVSVTVTAGFIVGAAAGSALGAPAVGAVLGTAAGIAVAVPINNWIDRWSCWK